MCNEVHETVAESEAAVSALALLNVCFEVSILGELGKERMSC